MQAFLAKTMHSAIVFIKLNKKYLQQHDLFYFIMPVCLSLFFELIEDFEKEA